MLSALARSRWMRVGAVCCGLVVVSVRFSLSISGQKNENMSCVWIWDGGHAGAAGSGGAGSASGLASGSLIGAVAGRGQTGNMVQRC